MMELFDQIKATVQLEFELRAYSKSSQYVKSPFRYPGGKFYALKHILPFISSVPHDEFREPFLGGGSVFFAKEKATYNWLNDLESELINTYSVIQSQPLATQLMDLVRSEVATRQRHSEIKDLKVETVLERAYKTYYLNRTSFSGIINRPAWGYRDGKSSPPPNWPKFIEEASVKLQNCELTAFDFEKVINAESKGETVLMYLDPPYYHADQKRAYTRYFVKEDHERLAQCLVNTEHLFCLSYDDCTEVRELYSWAHLHEKSWLYNTANKKNTVRGIGNELIITNYKVI